MRSKPKKRLGQNFLLDRNILNKIVAALDLRAQDVVLEIGAGRGELTALIAPRVSKVLAVEIDAELVPELAENLKIYPNVRIINADILRLDLKKRIPAGNRKIKVIGNIPYYISSPIMARIFKYHKLISSAYITVQKEFAVRVAATAGNKDYGSLSCWTQFYSEPRILFSISKNCFFPRPKVDSSLLALRFRNKPLLAKVLERKFFKITRAAFNQRRKTLRNSLSEVASRAALEAYFKKYSFDPDIRPEKLRPQDFINLAKELK
ncbi:MAG: 16S rRNA (adenine(1518)-N(6)/adenine(1519)-N(6))-dimethyltransferase RsmA [Candidatus Omnitrophota bacterium]|nr:16S rRNA (adenine(1518)-N(6)/adenine(1519)-N(6))-dimethyltransferase RsmA [Candidatus Omnitrophota bacterium]